MRPSALAPQLKRDPLGSTRLFIADRARGRLLLPIDSSLDHCWSGAHQILTAVGRIIRHRDRVRADWLPLLWAAVLLVIYVQVWWSMFGLRHVHEWTFGSFAAVLAETGTLYLMAAVVLPEQVGDQPVDLAAYYDQHHQWFFGFLLVTLVVSVIKDVIINGSLPGPLNLGFHLFLTAVSVSALFIRRRRYQEFVGVASAGAFVAYVALLFTRLR